MSDRLVNIEGAPRAAMDPREIARIAVNLAAVCAIGALVLGGVYMATEKYKVAAQLAGEKRAVTTLLALGPDAKVLEVSQYLAAARKEVVYRARPYGDDAAPVHQVVFTLTGELKDNQLAAPATVEPGLVPLGRLFVATRAGAPAGFVIEGETRGYKNRIRFFIALDTTYTVQGVRVVEHEEDPGLGAEVATTWFSGQFVGRSAGHIGTLDVAKSPMSSEWRAALDSLAIIAVPQWRQSHARQLEIEGGKPIYAVTGATISSRALTNGVRTTIEHFMGRWNRLRPLLEGKP